MDGGYQKFYKHWCDDPNNSKRFRNRFPYKLSLGVNSAGRPLLPFCPYDTSGSEILVTKSYDDMLHRLLRLRERDNG